MRIWIDPDRAAARNLTVDDVVAALASHNVQVAAGALGQPPQAHGASAYQLNVQALGRLSTPDQFANIIVKTDPQGRVTRISGRRARREWAPPTTPPTPTWIFVTTTARWSRRTP